MKHTPGPWNIHGYYSNPQIQLIRMPDGADFESCRTYIAKDEKIIGDVSLTRSATDQSIGGWPTVTDRDEMLANANLIASAPELLEALEKLLQERYVCNEDEEFDRDGNLTCNSPACELARLAISKAKGIM